MDPITSHDWKLLMLTGVLVSLLAWPGSSEAQTVTGQASAVQATVFGALGLGTTTALSDTGTLGGTRDAREASLVTGAVPSLLTGEALHAVTIGWPDQVASEASLGTLGLSVAGTGISADFVMARATALLGAAGSGFASHVALLRTVVRGPVGALAQRDHREQSPESVPGADVESAVALPEEEALVRGLNHVFGIDFRDHSGVEVPAGQPREPRREPHEHLTSGRVLAGA